MAVSEHRVNFRSKFFVFVLACFEASSTVSQTTLALSQTDEIWGPIALYTSRAMMRGSVQPGPALDGMVACGDEVLGQDCATSLLDTSADAEVDDDIIVDALYTFAPNDECNYAMRIDFINAAGKSMSSKDLIFTPQSEASVGSAFAAFAADARRDGGARNIVDIESMNGQRKSKLKIGDFMRPQHLEEILGAVDVLNGATLVNSENNGETTLEELMEDAVRVFVIDLRSSDGSYGQGMGDMREAELQAQHHLTTFRGKVTSANQQIASVLRENRVDYFIAEGSLKNRLLLDLFKKKEAAFLENTKMGAGVLCQIGEIIMNGFKTGYVAQASEGEFFVRPDEFFFYATPEAQSKGDSIEERVRLDHLHAARIMTIYATNYRTLYGADNTYFRSLKAASGFDASHHHTSSGFSTIDVKATF